MPPWRAFGADYQRLFLPMHRKAADYFVEGSVVKVPETYLRAEATPSDFRRLVPSLVELVGRHSGMSGASRAHAARSDPPISGELLVRRALGLLITF